MFTVKDIEWDTRFMRLAHEVSKWSKDPEEVVGAIIVSPDRRMFSSGYNGLPQGMCDDPEVLCNKELKNKFTIHAELNAILNKSCNIDNWSLYTTKAPCINCALAIKQNKIKRIVCEPIRQDSRWALQQQEAISLLENLNIAVSFINVKNNE